MIFRSLDSNGDWNFGAGKSSYARYNDAIVLDIETKLKAFRGECFFDSQAGVPWFDLIDLKNKDSIALFIKSFVIGIYGVIAIKDLEYTYSSNRVMNINYKIDTLYENDLVGTVIL